MRLVHPRSEVAAEPDGWTWLRPVAASTRRRHTLGTFLLAVLILGAMATATLLGSPAAIVATVAVAALAATLLIAMVRSAASRVALSGVGIYLQEGASALAVGWPAIRGVTGVARAGRVRIVIDDGYRSRTTRGAFDPAVAAQWLDEATREAARRRLNPQAADNGLGFTAAS